MLCRWATEDPNPGQKRAEEQRILAEGQKAISGMMDEGLIEATQTLRALEDGDVEDFYPIEASRPDDQDEEDERPQKRIRNGDTGGSGNASAAATTNGSGSGASKAGLLGGEALENIRYYAEMSRKQAAEDQERKRKLPSKGGMSLLGGYGSDSD